MIPLTVYKVFSLVASIWQYHLVPLCQAAVYCKYREEKKRKKTGWDEGGGVCKTCLRSWISTDEGRENPSSAKLII